MVGTVRYRVEELSEILTTLVHYSPEFTGSLLVSNYVLSIVSYLPYTIEEDRAAAKTAVMLVLAERVASELRRGDLTQICLQGESGHLILTAITPDASLAVLCRVDARLPLVMLDIQYSTAELQGLLSYHRT